MCGRVRLSSDVSEIKLVFSIPPERPPPNFPPSWNVAPTDSLPVVEEGRRRQAALRDQAQEPRPDGAGGSVGKLALASGRTHTSFAVITTAPNELSAQLNNRMPAIIAPEAWPA